MVLVENGLVFGSGITRMAKYVGSQMKVRVMNVFLSRLMMKMAGGKLMEAIVKNNSSTKINHRRYCCKWNLGNYWFNTLLISTSFRDVVF